jgi:16S rRNA (uracil1498-N3)-methyltransferase
MATSPVTLSITADRPCTRPQPKLKNVTLMFSLIKSKQVRLVVEKATELGVTSIWPVISERAQKKNAVTDAELGKLRVVATMATEQSERMAVPIIEPVQSLDAALRSLTSTPSASSSTTRALFICEERSENSVPLLDALVEMEASCAPSSQSGHGGANCEPIFLVGPEGGWAEGEVDRALASLSPDGNPAAGSSTGSIPLQVWRVSLGLLILRAETASICSLSVWNSFRDGYSRSSLSGAQRDEI